MGKFLTLLVVLLLLLRGIALSQKEDRPVILDHADSLVGMELNGEQVRVLIGHVQFHQGKTIVKCQRATQYLVSNKIALEGVVEVQDDSMRMVGMRGMYDGETRSAEVFDRVMVEDRTTVLRAGYGQYFVKEKRAFFKTRVSVEDTTSLLTADELTYFREEEKSIATGNVTIVNGKNDLTILGNRFENFKKQKYSKISDHPRVLQIDTTGGKRETLVVTSRVMESYQDSVEMLVATDSVNLTRNGLAAEAGVGMYYTKLDSIVLRRSPFVWYGTANSENNQVSGDSIFLKLERRKLKNVFVRGRAFAISRPDSQFSRRFNQMSGREIILRFAKDRLRQIDVNATATSLYYLFDQTKGNGMNKTSGDRVVMSFADGKIDRINVIAGVQGQYYPERLIKGRESEYNLQGFNWRENRPGRVRQPVQLQK